MNTKILSILVLLLVGIGFSGLATAVTTQEVLVSEAYDEQVLVSPAYDEEVLVTPAVDEHSESVPYSDLYILQGPNEMREWHDFIWANGNGGGWGTWQYFPETSHIEQQLVSEAYDEVVDPVIEEQEVRSVEYGYSWKDKQKQHDKAVEFGNKQVAVHGYNGYFITDHPCQGQGHWTVHFLDDVVIEEGYTIHHPAVYEDIKVVDEAAHYLVDGEYIINHPAVPAVYETVHHDAVYETVHHPAVYKIVIIDDPVIPVAPEEVPMLPTGGSAVPIAAAILLVLAGVGIVASRRK